MSHSWPHTSRHTSERSVRSPAPNDKESVSVEPASESTKVKRRIATVYDAVAGRVGLNGFLTPEQLRSENLLPSKPEEVLLRRIGAPDVVTYDYYHADERLGARRVLPDTDLLKAIHVYASDFYSAATEDGGLVDFRSLDETALLALGILLEEASKEALNEGGDMMLLEPEGREHELPVVGTNKDQIIGRVKPRVMQVQPDESMEEHEDEDTDELAREESPRKKRRGLRELRYAELL